MSREKQQEALQKGEIQVRCKRAGMYQILPFKLMRYPSPAGMVPYLVLDKYLEIAELTRIAEEYWLPVKALNGKVYPRGTKESDFAGL
ncbi:MAG: hypothetical protein N3G80_00880 [Candidatus Micrarchaeota archaeon]|nr:hypothetical protein [Candidatus Micrarchaeota archaeon]